MGGSSFHDADVVVPAESSVEIALARLVVAGLIPLLTIALEYIAQCPNEN
jgi:hypothetical protein